MECVRSERVRKNVKPLNRLWVERMGMKFKYIVWMLSVGAESIIMVKFEIPQAVFKNVKQSKASGFV